MKVALLLLFSFSFFFSCAQAVWCGSSPSKPQAWSEPRNWKNNRLPEIWEKVIIPDVSNKNDAYPILKNENIQISALEIHAGAEMNVNKNSQLIIDGSENYDYGILLMGKLTNKGTIIIKNPGIQSLEQSSGILISEGKFEVIIEGQLPKNFGLGKKGMRARRNEGKN